METKHRSRPESAEKIARIEKSRQAEEKDAAQMAEITNLANGTRLSAMDVMQTRAKKEDADNHDVAGAIERVKAYPLDLAKLKPAFRDNKEIVLAAVKADGTALEHASDKLRADKDVVLAAWQTAPHSIVFVHPSLIEKDMQFALYYYSLKMTKFDDLPAAFRSDQQFIQRLLFLNFELLSLMPAAIQDDTNAVEVAVLRSPRMLEYASKRLRGDRQFIFDAMVELAQKGRNGAELLSYADKSLLKDEEFLYKLMQVNLRVAPYVPKKFLKKEAFILLLSAREPQVIATCGSKLKDDAQFMAKAVRMNAANMKWASPLLKRDHKFIKSLVAERPGIVAHIADELKKDRNFMLELLDINGLVFKYLDPKRKYQHDKEMAVRALKNNPNALKDVTNVPDFIFEVKALRS